MDYLRIAAPGSALTARLRTAGITLGSALLIAALVALLRVAWDPERMALIERKLMLLTLPLVVTGAFLWVAGLILLVIGEWPPRRSTLAEVAASALLPLMFLLIWIGTSQLANVSNLETDAFIIGLGLTVLVYVGAGALIQQWWWLLAAPSMTATLVSVTIWWLVLDTRLTGENQMAIGFFAIIFWFIVVPATFVLTALGIMLGAAIAPRADLK
jgi:hypothetical protein